MKKLIKEHILFIILVVFNIASILVYKFIHPENTYNLLILLLWIILPICTNICCLYYSYVYDNYIFLLMMLLTTITYSYVLVSPFVFNRHNIHPILFYMLPQLFAGFLGKIIRYYYFEENIAFTPNNNIISKSQLSTQKLKFKL